MIPETQALVEQCAAIFEQAVWAGYEEPVGADQCQHGAFRWEACISCYDEHLLAAVAQVRALASLDKLGGVQGEGVSDG